VPQRRPSGADRAHKAAVCRQVAFAAQGNADEIAAMVRLLADPERGYATGQTVRVNSGASLT
jgi:NAD(P)-dependent dehydrogenase (short-subunit alcohol dehydrogenase family)